MLTPVSIRGAGFDVSHKVHLTGVHGFRSPLSITVGVRTKGPGCRGTSNPQHGVK